MRWSHHQILIDVAASLYNLGYTAPVFSDVLHSQSSVKLNCSSSWYQVIRAVRKKILIQYFSQVRKINLAKNIFYSSGIKSLETSPEDPKQNVLYDTVGRIVKTKTEEKIDEINSQKHNIAYDIPFCRSLWQGRVF